MTDSRKQKYRIARDSDGTFSKWAWPGGYPVYHVTADSGILCAKCANSEKTVGTGTDVPADWRIVASDINWEDSTLTCDNCSEAIPAAYKDDGE